MSLMFESKFDVTKTINTKITVSDYEIGPNPATTHSPEKIINNDSYDGSRRWTAFGNNHFINFEFDDQIKFYGISIAWSQGNEYRYTFKITSTHAPSTLFSGVSTGVMGSYETYKFKTPITTDNIRIRCQGNLLDEWNRITSIRFRLDPITDVEATVSPFPDCPEGQHWHEALQTCVDNHITKPPVIVITDPIQTVKHGDNVLIDATGTKDPVGSNLFFEWTQIGGELVRTGSLLQPGVTFRAPTLDTELKFRLKVTNAGNVSATKDATVVVRAAIPQCPPGQVWDESLKQCIKSIVGGIREYNLEKPMGESLIPPSKPTGARSTKPKSKHKQ